LTAGYRVLRRGSERCGELLGEEVSGAGAARAEKLGSGSWRTVVEVPVARPGGEPTGEDYSVLDKSAPAGGEWEYLVEELESCGCVGATAEAKP
jgi:hypothetical protein